MKKKKNIVWKEDIRCQVPGVEILEMVAREGFTEKVTFWWRSGGSQKASYKSIQCFWISSVSPTRPPPPSPTQLCALVG